ncbi:MAG: xylulokinase [Rhodobacteraceae bacterium HLUCCA09]|nr:MAG: xylulokinase [Rhodobacteraceae bacterium HLUCCA09]
MGDVFIGLDAGSSVCKAGVFDLRGRCIAVASEATPLARRPGGRVEADPARAWAAACAVLRRASGGLPADARIAGLGVSGAMVGAWVVDADGHATGPGINWEDARAEGLIHRIEADGPGTLAEIFATSGSALQQGCTLPVLAVLAREEPERLARAAAVIGYKDWLRARLTGTVATDASEAAVAPGDARSQGRSAAMIDLFGLRAHAHLLPDPLPSAAVAGHVTAEAAAATGLPAGLPVATGAGDVIANVIGAGGLRPGAVTGLLGTTCMVGRTLDAPSFTPQGVGLLFSLPERMWFRAMVNVAGTLNLDWALALLCPDLADRPDRFARVAEMAAAVPVGALGVTYLPYLSESGIIAPVADAAARAQFAGLAPSHDRAALMRAVFEGVAFSIADLCDLLGGAGAITLTGGGARSALWREMIAEVTGREVCVPEGAEFGARGAAMLAAVAVGGFPGLAEATAALPGHAERTRPSGERASAWAEARARYAGARDRALGTGAEEACESKLV